MQDYKLSLPSAILININIMLGAGLFINTAPLAKQAGLLGSFEYLLIGALMLPLILSIAELLRMHPEGGFYTYAKKEINPFMGFLSSWCYFTAKLASCMLMIHVSMTLFQSIFIPLKAIHPFFLDFAAVAIFSYLNLLNLKAGASIQKMFIVFKTLPIFFAILTGLFLLQSDHLSPENIRWEGLQTSLPLVVYAVIGFEAACSISSKIKDAKKNAPIAVVVSFCIVIMIAMLYQGLFYGALGEMLTACSGHCDVFPALLNKALGNNLFAQKFDGILHLAIASSTLGAAYGILFSNSWNLHTLAENKHIWNSKLFGSLNSNQIPFACVMAEGVICLVYLAVSQGVLVPLQQIGALGCVFSYTLSVIALQRAIKVGKAPQVSTWIPKLALISCAILILACLRSFFLNGMDSLLVYSCLIATGVVMFQTTNEPQLASR